MPGNEVKDWAAERNGSLHFTILEVISDGDTTDVVDRGFINDTDSFIDSDEAMKAAEDVFADEQLIVEYTAYVLCGTGEGRAADDEEIRFIREHLDEIVEIADFAEGGRYMVDNPYYTDMEGDEDENERDA